MKNLSGKRLLAVILGNVILGVGVALLRISQMGNDPYGAVNMALSDWLGIGLGTFQLTVNIVIFIVQLIAGRRYIGLGTMINFVLLGYITEYSWKFMIRIIGTGEDYSMPLKFIVMVISMIVLTFGLAMYQASDTGVAPYDYLSIGMTEHLPTPYFVNRIITDGSCVLIIVIALLLGCIRWSESHLGVGTVIAAFCLGPLINMFLNVHKKWIQ